MFSHVIVGARDLDEAKAFYDAVLGALGIGIRWDGREHGWLGYGREGEATDFWVCRPIDGKPASIGNGVNVGFAAGSAERVHAAHAAGLAHGGTNEGDIGPRAQYSADWYGGYLRDPTGNKICINCRIEQQS